jgi:hypothetical protein
MAVAASLTIRLRRPLGLQAKAASVSMPPMAGATAGLVLRLPFDTTSWFG